MAIHVREKPPLRQSIIATTPSGKRYRWGEDEPRPENVFSDLRYSDSMPGGYETMDCSLPRKTGMASSDMERLTTLNIYGAGGEPEGEYRLERAPLVSGDRMVISPSAAGWQAHLEDDKSAKEIYVDRDLSRWEPMTRARRANHLGLGISNIDPSVNPDQQSGLPALSLELVGPISVRQIGTATYDAGSAKIGALYHDSVLFNIPAATWETRLFNADGPDPSVEIRADFSGSNVAEYVTPATPRRFVQANLDSNSAVDATDGKSFSWQLRKLAVYGNHGLTRRQVDGTDPGGFWASDVVAHALAKWAPLLKINPDSIRPSNYVIPQVAFLDPTTAAEIVRQASRFELPYWGVWDDREFVFDPNRTPRKRWRARVGPAQLEEAGQSVERLWESIMVQYRDVDGSTRTVGPPGSGANTEDASLKDSDPENPANRLGMVKRDLLMMGTGTAGSAIQVGRQFLSESKLLDTSGRARLVGFVEDDRGVVHPYSRVRSGDVISFVDAADPSYRRVVHSEKVRSERACQVDLDAPPEGLKALLERLDVELVTLGL